MDDNIIKLLKSKPHNIHYLNKYISFIDSISNLQSINSFNTYTERHHILPKAKDFFPEYKSFKDYPWNKIILTSRQHFIAHHMLYKAYGGTMAGAFKRMYESKQNSGKLTSQQYAEVKKHFSEHMSKIMTGRKRSKETCEKISNLRKIYYSNQDNRDKQSIACLGISRSEQARKNISNGAKNRKPMSNETREKISKSKRGRIVSQETKDKMRGVNNPNFGKKPSQERIAKQKESAKLIPKIKCEHCSTISSPGNYTRWHGPKCRPIN